MGFDLKMTMLLDGLNAEQISLCLVAALEDPDWLEIEGDQEMLHNVAYSILTGTWTIEASCEERIELALRLAAVTSL